VRFENWVTKYGKKERRVSLLKLKEQANWVRLAEDSRQLMNEQKDLGPEFAACSEENWVNVLARDKFTKSKIVVLQSVCEGYPVAKNKVELTRTQVLLRGSEGKVKLLSEMVARIQKTRSEDHQSGAGSVPKGEQDCHILKAMVFSLDKENADLQHQLLEREAASTALKSTIANLQRELQETSHQRSEEVSALVSQLHVSDRHIFKLECQSVELRDAMQRQAVAFKTLQKQDLSLQEELMGCRKKAERYQAKARKLKSQVDVAADETERLRSLVEDLERSRGQLQEEVKRKQCAVQALEEHLLKSQQSKLQCQEELHLCEKKAEVNQTQAQEKQVEVEILRKSVEELENTVFALESQVSDLT
jgi:chromosome segregation ATPase